jgi:hypothetical protein
MDIMKKVEEYKLKRNLGLMKKAFIKVKTKHLYLKDNEYVLLSGAIFQLRDSDNKLFYSNMKLKDSFKFKSAHPTNWKTQITSGSIDDIDELLIRSWCEKNDR